MAIKQLTHTAEQIDAAVEAVGAMGPGLALGETNTTAYRGDRGKSAYDHSQAAHAPSDANNYVHPLNHAPSIISQDANNRFVTDAEKTTWNGKQANLVSGTNIKTINGTSVLGSGDIIITGTGGGMTFDVTSYGAVGNGATNDSAAVQSAITAAMAVLSDQAEVWVPEGVFNLNGTTITMSGISLSGPGQLYNGVIEVGDGGRPTRCNTKQVMFRVTGNGVTIDGCEIGNWTQSWAAGISITTPTVSNLTIIRNHIHHISQPAGYGSSGPTSYGAGIKFESTTAAWSNINIIDNEINNINGPGGIWFGTAGTVKDVMIAHNHIHDTALFGIIGYTISYNEALKANNFIMTNNLIENIGSIRDSGAGNGSGGIYMVLGNGLEIKAVKNTIRHIAEIGIEGLIGAIVDNYIEDTGAFQYDAPIVDCSAMYSGLSNALIKGNTIVRPGGQANGGGFYLYIEAGISGIKFLDNTFDNGLIPWLASTAYKVGDIVSRGTEWYVCTTAGTTASTGPSGQTGAIADGTVVWKWKKTIPLKCITLNSAAGPISNICIQGNRFIDFPTKLDIARSSGGNRIDNNSYHHVYNTHTTWLTQWGGTSGTNYQRQPYVDDIGIPAGGVLGDFLIKNSSVNGDVGWSSTIFPTYSRFPAAEDDFLGSYYAGYSSLPWRTSAMGAGTCSVADTVVDINHPGQVRAISAAAANSGFRWYTSDMGWLIGGSEEHEIIFQVKNVANTVMYSGFHDANTEAAPVDGVWLDLVNGTFRGACSSNSTRTNTGSTYTVVANKWYRAKLLVNEAASSVAFTLHDCATGTLLWSSSVTTNIPTGAGRWVGNQTNIFTTGTIAQDLIILDYMAMGCRRTLVR